MTKFQLILTGIFGLFLVGGVIVFSAYRGNAKDAAIVTIWGAMPELSFSEIVGSTSLYQNKEYKINYVQKSEENFDTEFIEALASGTGPDLFMLPSSKILKHRNKIFPIPYTAFTERQFKDSFIEGAEIYMAPEGTLGMPVSVDPLVMYWNRATLQDAKITEPPKYWDEFYNLATALSKKDGALNILKSAVSFGEFGNVAYAKEIIINLAMQAGTPVAVWDKGNASIVFDKNYGKPILPADAAINFYTEFSNPAKPSYSWNRSLPKSTSYFLSGDLALYFGFASEIRNLQLKNPNLNFDVAAVPTSREGGSNISYGRFNAFAITKSSKNPNAAFVVASILSGKEGATAYNKISKLPTVRRDLLGIRPANAYESVFYASAIKARGWLDPNPDLSDGVFRNLIDSITSGRARTSEAVAKAQSELSKLISK